MAHRMFCHWLYLTSTTVPIPPLLTRLSGRGRDPGRRRCGAGDRAGRAGLERPRSRPSGESPDPPLPLTPSTTLPPFKVYH